jgi:hypothetical protein
MLCAAACRPVELETLQGDWSVAPVELGFGGARSRDLIFTNRAAIPVELTLELAPPFSAPHTVQLAAAQTRSIPVRFDPLAEGDVVSSLTVSSATRTEQVALSASPRACAPARACERVELSSGGQCVPLVEDDGTACASACVTHGTCESGQCRGAATDCSDDDACTDDACGEDGCTHFPHSCPGSSDPCQVAACDARLGCVLNPAEDGTSCGTASCTTSLVCVRGSCVERQTPEGAVCGTESPCQARGVCADERCVQPPPRALVADWVYRPPQGTVFLDVAGIADAQGNLFWVERSNAQNWLVSLNATGTPRYRVLMDEVQTPGYAAWDDMLLSGASVVMGSAASDAIEAHDAATGALRWVVRLLPDLLVPRYLEAGCSPEAVSALQPDVIRKWSLASDGATQLAIGLNVQGSCLGSDDLWLIVLDTGTGALHWAQRRPVSRGGQGFWVQHVELAFDEQGNATALFRAPSLADSTIASFTPAGGERWSDVEAGTGRSLKSLAQGRLLVSRYATMGPLDSEVLSLANGVSHQWAPVSSGVSGLADGPWATMIDFSQAPRLVTFDFVASAATAHPLLLRESQVSSPVMTSRQTFLIASASGIGMWLQEFELSDGTARATCELAGATLAPWSAPVLSAGRWIVKVRDEVRAYPAFGASAANSGWVTSRGQATRSGSPRVP